MQQEISSEQLSQDNREQGSIDHPVTQSQDTAGLDEGQQGTRQHRNADAAVEGRFEVGGDPNQMGTHGHPQDESLRNGPAGSRWRGIGESDN